MNPLILGAIIVQYLISRASRKAGAIVGFLITTGILIWGLSVYAQSNMLYKYYITFFGIRLSQTAFLLLCLVWYAFDVREFVRASKAEDAKTLGAGQMPGEIPPPAQGVAEDLYISLKRAEELGDSGKLEEAAYVLEEALSTDPSYAPQIAGDPYEIYTAQQTEPPSGYALLVHLAGKTGRKELAIKYFTRMLDLNPKEPDSSRQAAREAKIEKEAMKIAQERGISWKWWE